jgi:hypothetical protein
MHFWNFYLGTNLGAGSPDSIRAQHKEAPYVKASERDPAGTRKTHLTETPNKIFSWHCMRRVLDVN